MLPPNDGGGQPRPASPAAAIQGPGLGKVVLLGGEEASRVSVLVAFSVTPLGVGESVGELVAEAVRVVRESGLANRTGAMFTEIEGDSWDEVMAVVQRAAEAVAARAPRVSVVVKVDWRPAASNLITEKVESVERHLT